MSIKRWTERFNIDANVQKKKLGFYEKKPKKFLNLSILIGNNNHRYMYPTLRLVMIDT